MLRFSIVCILFFVCSTAQAQLFRQSRSSYTFDNSSDSYNYKGRTYTIGVDGPVNSTCQCAMCQRLRAALQQQIPQQQVLTSLDPSSMNAVKSMLTIAKVGKGDVVFDPGCGDGRILIEAAKLGAKGVGIELNRQSADLAYNRTKNNPNIKVYYGDSTKTHFQNANVVLLYMYPEVIKQLVPKLLELPPGTRVVSHAHDIEGLPTQKYTSDGVSFFYWVSKETWRNYAIK